MCRLLPGLSSLSPAPVVLTTRGWLVKNPGSAVGSGVLSLYGSLSGYTQ